MAIFFLKICKKYLVLEPKLVSANLLLINRLNEGTKKCHLEVPAFELKVA